MMSRFKMNQALRPLLQCVPYSIAQFFVSASPYFIGDASSLFRYTEEKKKKKIGYKVSPDKSFGTWPKYLKA